MHLVQDPDMYTHCIIFEQLRNGSHDPDRQDYGKAWGRACGADVKAQ